MTRYSAAPVSGEILTEGAAFDEKRFSSPKSNVVDAEFVVLGTRSAALTTGKSGEKRDVFAGSQDLSVPEARMPPDAGDGLGLLRANTEGASASNAGPRTGFYALSAIAIAATFWFSGGYSLLTQSAPERQSKQPSGVSIVGLESRFSESPGGKKIILLNGAVENRTQNPAGVPPLAVKVSEQGGANRRYVFGTQNKVLGGGESYRFALRLDAPDRPVDKLTVEFSRE